MEILPSFDPDITYLLQGENATVHKSTGPKLSKCFCCPVWASQKHKLESSELLAIATKNNHYNHNKNTELFISLLLCPSELTATETTPRA